jgi:hypothetical protein
MGIDEVQYETIRNAEVIRRLFDAVERRDLGAVMESFAPSVVINEPPSLPYGGEYSGPKAVVLHAKGYTSTWDPRQDAAHRLLHPKIIAQGDHVAVVWRQCGRDVESGASIDLPAVSIYRLAEGKVVEARMFHFDTVRLMDFLEGSAQRG